MTRQRAPHADGTLQVSLREYRLVVERLFQLAGVDAGMLRSAVDVATAAEVSGGGTLEVIAGQVRDGTLERCTVQQAGAIGEWPILDAEGTSTLLVADIALDVASQSEGVISPGCVVVNARHVEFAAALAPMASRRGFLVEVVAAERRCERQARRQGSGNAEDLGQVAAAVATRYPDASTQIVVAVRPGSPRTSPVGRLVGDEWTAAAVREQVSVDRELWWSIFERANRALTPASAASRLDTGIVRPAEEALQAR